MKIRNLLSILFIGTSLFSTAQQNKFIGGILLNLNGISFTGNTKQYWNSSNGTIWGGGGVSAGLFVKREFSEKFYSTLELRYSNKGSVYEFASQFGTKSLENLFLNYAEIPVLFGYKIEGNKKTYYFETGLAFAKMISSNLHSIELLNRTGTPNAEEFKSEDVSWVGSFKFPLTNKWKEKFLFGLRVSHSIIPIHKYYKIYHFDYGVELNYLFN